MLVILPPESVPTCIRYTEATLRTLLVRELLDERDSGPQRQVNGSQRCSDCFPAFETPLSSISYERICLPILLLFFNSECNCSEGRWGASVRRTKLTNHPTQVL